MANVELENLLSEFLTDLSDCALQDLAKHLEQLGVQKRMDLKEVREEDLLPFVTIIQARRVVKIWNTLEGIFTVSENKLLYFHLFPFSPCRTIA